MTQVFSSTLSEADQARAIAILSAAFASDPAVRWMYPDAEQHQRYFPDFVRAFAGGAFDRDTADVLKGFCGVALWLPPDAAPDDSALASLVRESVPEARHEDVFSLFEQMGQFHPPQLHWYLPLIGVDPSMQNLGLGSGLLTRGIERCDRERLPAYLEATSAQNIPLYERFGFRVLGRIRTESSPVITPMLRQPR